MFAQVFALHLHMAPHERHSLAHPHDPPRLCQLCLALHQWGEYGRQSVASFSLISPFAASTKTTPSASGGCKASSAHVFGQRRPVPRWQLEARGRSGRSQWLLLYQHRSGCANSAPSCSAGRCKQICIVNVISGFTSVKGEPRQ